MHMLINSTHLQTALINVVLIRPRFLHLTAMSMGVSYTYSNSMEVVACPFCKSDHGPILYPSLDKVLKLVCVPMLL